MNNHLLPFPYNQSQPHTWLDRLRRLLSHLFLRATKQAQSQRSPNRATPIGFPDKIGDDSAAIRIVCVSDTHNATPSLPAGDILIHAGDLTAHGTFDELQAQLRWLSAQPHQHKIVIAGNHDTILDPACDTKFPQHVEDSADKRQAIDWSGVRYLQDETIVLELPSQGLRANNTRQLRIFGSPKTPEFGLWAFQYPSIRDVWTGHVPDHTDILVVHGSPALHGDCDGEAGSDGARNATAKGDGYLLNEIRRVKPKIVVCGHHHGAYGVTTIRHDGIQDTNDGLRLQWEGYTLFRALRQFFQDMIGVHSLEQQKLQETLVVNAAIASSARRTESKDALTIDCRC